MFLRSGLNGLGSRLWIQVVCVLLMASPFLSTLLSQDYLPGFDESYQLEAAVNIVSGRGYSASSEYSGDLSTPTFTYLTAWPRGYSLLVAAAMTTGASFSASAKVVKTALILLAIVTWLRLSMRLSGGLIATSLFGSFMGFFSMVCSQSPSDLVVLALFPLFLEMLFCATEQHLSASYNSGLAARRCLFAGTLAGLAVVFKYTAIPLVLVGLIWIAVMRKGDRNNMVRELWAFALPSTLVVGALFSANYINAKSLSTITEIPSRGPLLGWHSRWILESLSAFFVDAVYLPKVVIRDMVLPLLPGREELLRSATTAGFLGLLIPASLSLFRRGGRHGQLVVSVIVSYLSTAAFLGLTASLYFYDSEWNPLQHGRYYQWMVPSVVLCLVLAISPLLTRLFETHPRRILLLVIGPVVCAFISLNALYAAHLHRTTELVNSDAHLTFQKIEALMLSKQVSALVVFADADNFRAAPWKGTVNIHSAPATFPEGSYFSERTLVVMICSRTGSWDLYRTSNACELLGYDQAANRLEFESEPIGKKNTVYWRVFLRGPGPGQK